jgi:hypothetical protein
VAIRGRSYPARAFISKAPPPTTTVTQTVAGTYSWVCPFGVTTVTVECWGGGGAGGQRTSNGGGGGGGGGEYAKETLTVVPGTTYSYTVGAAGVSGAAAGNGGDSSFNTTSVVAHGGGGVAQNVLTGGTGGTGSTNTTHFNGGAGFTSAGTTGGGGGGSGGTSAVGNTATSATGATAVTGGGPGGAGATTGNTNGSAPASGPGGGGGGADRSSSGTRVGGSGAAGSTTITYATPPTPPMSWLTDTFATQDTVKWTFVGATVTGGQVSITPAGSSGKINSNTKNNLIGSAAAVEAVSMGAAGASWLVVYTDAVDGATYAGMYKSGANLFFREHDAATNDETSTTYDAVAHRWWRIRESAGSIFWDTSPDGLTWTNQRSKPTATLNLNYRASYAQLYADGASGVSIFDNFNVSTCTLAATTRPVVAAMSSAQTQTGTLAATLQTLVASMSASQTHQATLAATLQTLVASMVVNPPNITTTLDAALQTLVASMSASQVHNGTLAAVLQPLVAALSASQTHPATLAATVKPLVASMTASQTHSATLAASLPPPVAALSAQQTETAVLAATVRPAVFSGASAQTHTTTLAATLQALHADLLSGGVTFGSLAAVLRPPVAAMASSQLHTAILAATLRPVVAGMTAAQTETATLAAVIQAVDADLAAAQIHGASLAAVLQAPVAALVAVESNAGVLSAVLVPVVFAGSAGITHPAVLAAQLRAVVFAGTAIVTEIEPPPQPPLTRLPMVELPGWNAQVIENDQLVSLHTISGVQLYQFLPQHQVTLKWARERREVTGCDLVMPVDATYAQLPDITPWLHWISVWNHDGTILRWTGPIQKAVADRSSLQLASKDIGALMSRTRCPITKSWNAADPADIAAALWRAMLTHHNINVDPIVRPDPEGDRFDFSCVADSEMLSATMDKLVKLGLYWTVVAGIPILGPAPKKPITALSEDHFEGDGLQLVRDGSASYNDVLVRGSDATSRARYEMAGLGLQTIQNINEMSGVSNLDRATRQLARYSSKIHDAVVVPQGTTLSQQAPIAIDEMIPSVRVTVEAFDLLSLMELDRIEVAADNHAVSVAVAMENVVDLPELLDKTNAETGVSL